MQYALRILCARDKVSLLGCRRSGALYMSSDKLRARKLTEHTAYRAGDEVALCPPRPRLWPCSAEADHRSVAQRHGGTARFRAGFLRRQVSFELDLRSGEPDIFAVSVNGGPKVSLLEYGSPVVGWSPCRAGYRCRVVWDIMSGFGAALAASEKTNGNRHRWATVTSRARPDIVKSCVSALRSSSVTVESSCESTV